MKLRYTRTTVINPNCEGDVFTTDNGREVVFIRDGHATIARVEPWIHWVLRKAGLIKNPRVS
jgi:hypothetical protein